MSIDTYIVIPSPNPRTARRALDPESAETTTMGSDYVVLYRADRFADVQNDAQRYGRELAASLTPSVRKHLDPRGIAAYPEVGRAFADRDYTSLLQHNGPPLWLPTKRASQRRRMVKMLLVPVSPTREKILLAGPALVKRLVEKHVVEAIAGCLEIEPWIELQRTLFDARMLEGGPDGDHPADAVAARGGLLLYEDKTVDSARLIAADRVVALSEWLSSRPGDVIATVYALKVRSPAARSFPASLGPVPADDVARESTRAARADGARPALAVIQEAFARLVLFYSELQQKQHAVLAIRFKA